MIIRKSSTFLCGNESCRNQNRLVIIRLENETFRIIKRDQNQKIISENVRIQALKMDYECSHCGMEMVQSMTDRVCCPFQNAEFIHFNSSGCFSNSKFINANHKLK